MDPVLGLFLLLFSITPFLHACMVRISVGSRVFCLLAERNKVQRRLVRLGRCGFVPIDGSFKNGVPLLHNDMWW